MSADVARPRPLSKELIVGEALRYARDGELHSMSLRQLAAGLEVTPMALYRHIGSKDELLLEVTDLLLASKPLPEGDIGWRDLLRSLADGLRTLLVTYPDLVGVFQRQPVTTPTSRRRLAVAVEALTAAGFSTEKAIQAYAAVHTYTLGFCALEAGRSRFTGSLPADDDWTGRAIHRFVTDTQYQVGLGAMLAGLVPGSPPAP